MSPASLAMHGDGADQPRVKLLSREMVLPASPSPPHSLFLSCLDISWHPFPYPRGVFFYRSPRLPSLSDGQEYSSADARTSSPLVQQLKRSLSLCLVHYYCWCGRLAKGVDPPHRLFIDCNDAGVEFVEASVDMPLSLLAQDGFQMTPFFDQLCQAPDQQGEGEGLLSPPLLSVQATLFSDGGLALGVANSHVVADALSLWHFMVSWGECSRGVPLSVPPLHDRQRLAVPKPSPEKAEWSEFPELSEDDKADLEVELRREVESSTYEDKGRKVATGPSTTVDMKAEEAAADSPLPRAEPADACIGAHVDDSSAQGGQSHHPKPHDDASVVQCVLTLSASAVKKLKSEAGEGYTSLEVMCAHFWQRISAARKAPAGECTSLVLLLDYRSRMMPPLPPSYFGNVLTRCIIARITSRICKEPFVATTSRIHAGLAQVKLRRHPLNPSCIGWRPMNSRYQRFPTDLYGCKGKL